jgi:hypothetical protein
MFYRHRCGDVVVHSGDKAFCADTINKAISPIINSFDLLEMIIDDKIYSYPGLI